MFRKAHGASPPTAGFFARFGPALLILGAFAPLTYLHLHQLWGNEHYQHFPFVLLAAGLLLWNRSREVQSRGGVESRESRVESKERLATRKPIAQCGTILNRRALGLSFLLLVLATLVWSPWLAAVAAILAIGGILLRRYSSRNSLSPVTCHLSPVSHQLSTAPLGPWLLLWLLVPLPFDLDQDLTFRLQGVASRSASYSLEMLGVEHLLTGYTIELPENQFLVEEACSGIHSLFVLIAFSAILVVWQRRTASHSMLLIASAVAWALLVNSLRVSLLVAAETQLGWDLSTGWRHEVFGMLLFLSALVLLFFTDRLLLFCFSAAPSERLVDDDFAVEASRGKAGDVLATASPPSFSIGWPTASLFLLPLALQIPQFLREIEVLTGTPPPGSVTRLDLREELMPQHVAAWTRISYERQDRDQYGNLGRFSDIWTYSNGNAHAVVSFDYPFTGWHELISCYTVLDWRVCSRRVPQPPASSGSAAGTDVEVEFERGSDRFGFLLFSEFDRHGQFHPPRATIASRFLQRFDLNTTFYQFQLFCSSERPLTELDKQDLRQLYLVTREAVTRRLVREAGGGG